MIKKIIIFVVLLVVAVSHVSGAERRDAINVKDFGAAGDDKTDDIVAFEAAVKTLQEWETLYIPQGEYRLSRKLIIKNKHRSNIVSEGVIKPYGTYDDYLLQITNDSNDRIIPSMGLQTNIRGLKLDCEWKSRGIELNKLYDSSIMDLEVWRPYGTGISTPMLQEVSFIKPVIFAARPRFNNQYLSADEWNGNKTYSHGMIVKRSYNSSGYSKGARATWNSNSAYSENDIIVNDGYSYRCIKSNKNRNPQDIDHAYYWERVPVHYFMATSAQGNVNKDPWDFHSDNTTRQAKSAPTRYWKPVFADEAAWSMVGSGEMNTIDNVKIWNFISRSNATPVVIRVDNTENIPPLKIEFYAPQFHAITKQYINAFNREDYGWTIKKNEEVLNNGRLIEVPSSSGLKFFGGQIQLANIDYMKGLLVGTPGKTGNNTRMAFLGTHFDGHGSAQVQLSLQKSCTFYGKYFSVGTSIIDGGNGSQYKIDLDNETRKHQGSITITKDKSSAKVTFISAPLISTPLVRIVPKSDLRGLTYSVGNISTTGVTLSVSGNYYSPMQTATFTAKEGMKQTSTYNHNYGVSATSYILGSMMGNPGDNFRIIMNNNDNNSIAITASTIPANDVTQQWWAVWENKSPVDLNFDWYVEESDK